MQVTMTPLMVCCTCGTFNTDTTPSSPTPKPKSSVLAGFEASKPRSAQYTILPPAATGAMVNDDVLAALTLPATSARTDTWIGESVTCIASDCHITLSIVQLSPAV